MSEIEQLATRFLDLMNEIGIATYRITTEDGSTLTIAVRRGARAKSEPPPKFAGRLFCTRCQTVHDNVAVALASRCNRNACVGGQS